MKVLAFRFSAMGDVALTVPVLRGVLNQNPELEITLVTNKLFEPLFYDIDRLTFHGVKLKEYKGIFGMRRLYKELQKISNWDAVIDLHSVMRTWILGGLFKMGGLPVYRIDKGREEKAQLVTKDKQEFKRLKHTTERYLDVFRSSGLEGSIEQGASIKVKPEAEYRLKVFFDANGIDKKGRWIGLAPFSLHREKTWPYSKITELIEKLSSDASCQIFLLGGPDEAEELNVLAAAYKNCWNMAGVFSLEDEVALVHQLDTVIAMDSFNMHLAALCNTKVVSIWGATHHYAGFGPLNNNEQNIVEIPYEDLPCRPCSVFGNKPCYRKDWACLNGITADQVIAKI